MIFIIFSITLIYVILIGGLNLGFDRVKPFELTDLKPKTRFTVIIPFRNEEKNLPELLQSVSTLNYPKAYFQIIFVDDESADHSQALIHNYFNEQLQTVYNGAQFDIKILPNVRTTASPKKDAITLGISKAKYEWIVTTDADSILPKYWLDAFDECIQKKDSNFIAAPVTYLQSDGFLKNFQHLDILSLQAATIGSFGIKKPFLCNGANLAYKKQLFRQVNGFHGNAKIASGDDVFLLEKATRLNPSKVDYLKCKQAVVSTKAVNSHSQLIEQRVRWAAKTSAYKNLFGKLSGFVILLQNGLLICSIFLSAIGIVSWKELFYLFLIKIGCDFLLIYKSTLFFDQKKPLLFYIPAALYYPFFSVYVAFIAFFKGYQWKGRRYRH